MESLPAVLRTGSAVGWSAARSSVVIMGTSRPSSRIAATALGRSSVTCSGRTCPPLRTVKSIPPKPARLPRCARSRQFNCGAGFEKRQRTPRYGPPAGEAPSKRLEKERRRPKRLLILLEETHASITILSCGSPMSSMSPTTYAAAKRLPLLRPWARYRAYDAPWSGRRSPPYHAQRFRSWDRMPHPAAGGCKCFPSGKSSSKAARFLSSRWDPDGS